MLLFERKQAVFLLLLFIFSSFGVQAQQWAVKIRLSDKAVVSMVTIFPGEALYSMYGHTAIRVDDPENDIDLLYNYGQASVPFDSGFVPRFVSGDLPFILGVIDSLRAFKFYMKYEDRSIYEQVLDLSREEKQAVFSYLAENATEENRTYIYDFFFDNCTTRVRDLLYDVFGVGLMMPESTAAGSTSYREDISPCLMGVPYVMFGINLMLGRLTDTEVPKERSLYLPLQLMDAVEEARLIRDDGPAAFVQSSCYIYTRQRSDPAPFFPGPGAVLWLLFLAGLLLAVFNRRLSAAGRIFDFSVFFLTGAIGGAAALLWIFSGYEMTTWNLNVFWAWPTHIAAAFFFLRKRPGAEHGPAVFFPYLVLNTAVSGCVLIISPLLLQNLPAAVIPLMLTVIMRGVLKIVCIKKAKYAHNA